MSSDGSFIDDGSGEDEEEFIEEIIEDDDEHDEGDDGSIMNDILQEKLERIAVLELQTQAQESQIRQLASQANEQTISHQKEVYFLKLELDNSRRDCTAAEERMAELFDDLKHVATMQEKKLHQQLSDTSSAVAGDGEEENYNYAAEVLENQISMVQTTSGEVIKSLKDEIQDLMNDRGRMELDLLNQLATLDRQKRSLEADFKQRLEYKDETIQKLRQQQRATNNGNNHKSSTYNGEMDELEEDLIRLTDEKKSAEDLLIREREESDELIQRLENQNTKLQNKIESLKEDVTLLRDGPRSDSDHVQAFDRITHERQEISSMLENVAAIWERADSSIAGLEDSMDKLRPTDNDKNTTSEGSDRERLLSTLEAASLIYGQVKVALLLIEVRLRNQLQSIKNDRSSMTWAAPSDDEVVENMRDILKEGLTALKHVETTITDQVRQLEEKALDETKQMKAMIADRSKTLESMQEDHQKLEKDIVQLKDSSSGSTKTGASAKQEEEKQESATTATNAINEAIVEKLHIEVHRIVERLRQKNALILTMKQRLEQQKVREESLKKDLKRATLAAQQQQQRRPIAATANGSLTSPTKGKPLKFHSPNKIGSSGSRSLASKSRDGSTPISNKKGQPTSPQSLQPNMVAPNNKTASAILQTPPFKSKAGKKVDPNTPGAASVPAKLPLSPAGKPTATRNLQVSPTGKSNNADTSSSTHTANSKPAAAAAITTASSISGSSHSNGAVGLRRITSKVKSPTKKTMSINPPPIAVAPVAAAPVATVTSSSPVKISTSPAIGKANSNNNDVKNGGGEQFTSPTKPTKKLIPLLPSPREISKPRFHSPV